MAKLLLFVSIFTLSLVLIVNSVVPVEAYEGKIGHVLFEIIQDGKITHDNEKFIKAISDYVKNQSPQNFQEKKLLEKIIKYKNSYIMKNNKIEYLQDRAEYLQLQLDISKAKKDFQKIKHKIALNNFQNFKYYEDLDIQILEYVLTQDDPRLIGMALDGVVKKYQNFDHFKDSDFINEIETLRSDIKSMNSFKSFDENYEMKKKVLKSIKEFTNKAKDKVTKIKKSLDSYNNQRSDSKPTILNQKDNSPDTNSPDTGSSDTKDPKKDKPKKDKKDKPEKDKPKKDKKDK